MTKVNVEDGLEMRGNPSNFMQGYLSEEEDSIFPSRQQEGGRNHYGDISDIGEGGGDQVRLGERTVTWKGVIQYLGPAFLISVGYLDPGNWATDIEGGSRFGYQLLWVLVLSNLMAILLQTLAARLGIVTQSHLAELCRDEYPRAANWVLWLLAEFAVIATDLTEVLGTAIGINLVFRIPLIFAVILTGFDTLVLLTVQKYGMRRLEQVMFVFLSIVSLCFLIEVIFARPSIGSVLEGAFVPRLNRESLYVAIGIIGATVMPHNFYLHSALVISRIPDRRIETLRSECRYAFIDTSVALNAALFINCAILIIAAANFWTHGIVVLTLQKAHELLEKTGVQLGPVDMAQLLFGIALIASGQSSTLCGTLAGQFVMEGFLELKGSALARRLVTRLVAIIPAMVTIMIMGDKGTYQLLIYSQVVLSLQLPFAIIPMIKFTNSERRMGTFANRPIIKLLAWFSAWVTVVLNLMFVASSIASGLAEGSPLWVKLLCIFLVLPLCAILLIFLLWIALRGEQGTPMLYTVMDNSDDLLLNTPVLSPEPGDPSDQLEPINIGLQR
mmetsp:Transcript_17042/g.35415  ORF Transcript_17042/g.35415 Transcript_17042/m.35415 type:complete len:557 (-) Transcript_17042:553-2223(-)|eukprot:CAMPEP_0184685136 /NCGR_PEP_ID=MMETSP0312-20130426/17813_1 /TAXON_ID=31354 /ORGANISM="Compsopogon coeruleus, Strain SAG 36.94" /LENGTH=556 /DNA_ID=CAMNT_0027138941 /DNA_START=396 /DNA_END=2066 /DNA_ORIENTATION=-